jgi:hypothetical protein
MSTGPIIQFKVRESVSTFVFLKTSAKRSYRTFVNGGYIIRIKPMAIGILVVPCERELIQLEEFGKKLPIPTPIAIARKIHSVR